MEKRVSGLQEEVTRLQNSGDRLAERLQALEISALQARPTRAEEAKKGEERVVRPPLKVVHVGPGDSAPAEDEALAAQDPEESGPRPVLRDHGSKGASKAGLGQNAFRTGKPK